MLLNWFTLRAAIVRVNQRSRCATRHHYVRWGARLKPPMASHELGPEHSQESETIPEPAAVT